MEEWKEEARTKNSERRREDEGTEKQYKENTDGNVKEKMKVWRNE